MPDVSSRITTTPMLDAEPPCFRVSWIAWDSGFRGSGLRVGDRITAVNGLPVNGENRWKAIGQYAENQAWTGETSVALTVRRRKADAGWGTLEFHGALKPETFYSTAEGRKALAAGGPDCMAYDGFSESWSGWYDNRIVPRFTFLLDGPWQQPSFSSRYELAQHLEQKARVDYLAEHYPGAFAATVKADWERITESVQGPLFHLSDDDLKFRRAVDDRAQAAAVAANEAWTAFQAVIQADTIAAFPAIHPIRDKRDAVVGKYVVLPAIRNSGWLSQAGKTFFAFGSAEDGWYFADAETPASQAMLVALERFRRLVTPSIDESYEMIARILPEVDLKTISGRAYYGMQVEIVAALVGKTMFVDLTKRKDDYAAFAAEEVFDQPMHALPPDDASPKEVMEAFFGAVKTGDLKLWKALFADWWVGYLNDGRALLYPHEIRINEDRWEDSQRLMKNKVYDLRVAWVDDPVTITTGKEFKGAPCIEQVSLEVDHVGIFDGEYRLFNDVSVSRFWELQRVDGGPWRIHSIQQI